EGYEYKPLTIYLYDEANWGQSNSISAYVYIDENHSNHTWPGEEMKYNENLEFTYNGTLYKGFYEYVVPENLANGMAIFYGGSNSNRYPADGAGGLAIGNTDHIYFNNIGNANGWIEGRPTIGSGEIEPPVCDAHSRTLPVLYINSPHVAGVKDISDYNLQDKDYREATYYITDAEGNNLYGSFEEQLPLQIKARGNYTRTGFSKKPFKLKLGAKQGLLGLTKSKHFALLAHADDDLGYLKNFVGFYLGKKIFPNEVFTPQEKPIEVYINGNYRGLYFLTESIRVGDNRIMIQELADEETDPALISGGYVVELDNYPDDNQIVMNEANKVNTPLRITADTPEVYSPLQRKFVTEQFSTMNDLIGQNSDELWKYMDLDMAARYYVVMEILNHWEAYHGSTYLYRDHGEGQKWMFSPLWDCGNALHGDNINWIYEVGRQHFGNTWIDTMRRNSTFNNKVTDTFKWFWGNCVSDLYNDIDTYVNSISEAAKCDRARWKDAPTPVQYNDPLNNNALTNPTPVIDNSNMQSKKATAVNNLKRKLEFLYQHWGQPEPGKAEPEWNTIEAAPLPEYAKEGYEYKPLTIYLYDEANWGQSNSISAYVYIDGSHSNHTWPGVEMNYNENLEFTYNGTLYKGFYEYVVPENLANGMAIFYGGSDAHRYPANNKSGILIEETNHIFFNGSEHLWIEGTPEIPEPEPAYSGNLPVIFINHIGSAEDLANKVKTTATLYMESKGVEGANNIGSKANDATYVSPAEPGNAVTLEIKGHGSSTWNDWSKKPYKLEFTKKQQAFTSAAKSKVWLLLPWCADAELSFLRNIAGHELSRKAGMAWTPQEEPVEVVIDGDYQGLYFLVEKIRPSVNRVNTLDISDFNTAIDENNAVITPANWHNWIIELDNTLSTEDADYVFTHLDGNRENSYKIVSDAIDLNKDLNKAQYASVKDTYLADFQSDAKKLGDTFKNMTSRWDEEWQNVINPEEAYRYFIINELMDDPRAFETACYLWCAEYDSNGNKTDDARWHFGPVWDFSGAFANGENKNMLIHEDADQNRSPLMKMLWSNYYFRYYIADEYKRINGVTEETEQPARRRAASLSDSTLLSDIESALNNAAEKIDGAREADMNRWGVATQADNSSDYTGAPDSAASQVSTVMKYLTANKAMLDDRLIEEANVITGIQNVEVNSETIQYFDTQGRKVNKPSESGVYIMVRGNKATKRIMR
ncbi:MAG: CotH kinase family protein, partial [Muribaculaceae bacterium]|nr:CotH kinase family protein [Muribaculaceae bacterium]